MEKKDYTVLIAKSIIEELSVAEQAQLDEWLNESVQHREMYREMTEKHFTAQQIALYSSERADQAFQKFAGERSRRDLRRKKMRLLRFRRYAAMATIFVAATVFAYYYIHSPEYQASRPVRIAELPLQKKVPVLILSDGTAAPLDSLWLQLQEKDGSQIVRKEKGGLAYVSAGDSAGGLIYNTMVIPRMCDYHMILSDGTEVWLNAGSELRYPVSFPDTERVVYAKGEVYFKVHKDSKRPFSVVLDGLNVKVLGTSFNVSAYPDDLYAEVTLEEGSVAATAGEEKITLCPEQQIHFDRKNRKMTVRKVEVADYTCWKDGYYIFKHRTLGDVARVVARWYDVDVVFRREADANAIYTGVIYKEEDITGFIRRLKTISGRDCRLVGNKLSIE